MKINILGTEYDFQIVNKEDDKRLGNKDGYCDMYEKTIRVVDVKEDEDDATRYRNMNIELLKKIRELKEENRRLRYGNKN